MSVPMYGSEARVQKMSEEEMTDYIAGLQALAEIKPEAINRISSSLDLIIEVAQSAGFNDSVVTQAMQVKSALSRG